MQVGSVSNKINVTVFVTSLLFQFDDIRIGNKFHEDMFHRLRKLNFRSIVKKIVFAAKKLAQEMKGVDGSFPALPKVAMARYCGSVTFRMATRLQEGQKHKGLNETNTKIKEKMIISLSKSDILVYYQMSCNFNKYFLFNSICPGK